MIWGGAELATVGEGTSLVGRGAQEFERSWILGLPPTVWLLW